MFFILIHAQIGLGIITLPNDVFMKSNSDSWMSVLLAGVVIQLTIFIFGYLINRFPSEHLFEILPSLFGKWIGKFFVLLYTIYYACIAGIFLAKFSNVIKSWMLPLTPKWILIILILFLAVYAATERLQVIARFFLISSGVIFIYIVAFIYILKDANITYILPVATTGLVPIIEGISTSLYSFQGFEYLILIYPFVQSNGKGIIKTASIANVFVTLFYTFAVLLSLLFFSPNELEKTPEPTLYLFKSLNFEIIERPDLIFTSILIVVIVTSLIMILYVISLGLSSFVNAARRRSFVYIAASIGFILSMLIYGEYQIAAVSNFFKPFVFLFTIGLPIMFFFVSLIFHKKGKEDSP